MPLELRLRGKSTTQSHRSAIYYVDLTIREGMTLPEALQQARADAAERRESGFDQAALDEAARQGLKNGAFEESPDEGVEVMEEFYPGKPVRGRLPIMDAPPSPNRRRWAVS